LKREGRGLEGVGVEDKVCKGEMIEERIKMRKKSVCVWWLKSTEYSRMKVWRQTREKETNTKKKQKVRTLKKRGFQVPLRETPEGKTLKHALVQNYSNCGQA
jgi:hypothetical protein